MDGVAPETGRLLGPRPSWVGPFGGMPLRQVQGPRAAGTVSSDPMNRWHHGSTASVRMAAHRAAAALARWHRPLVNVAMAAGVSLSAGSVALATPLVVVVHDSHGAAVADAVVSVEVNGQPSSAPPGTLAQMAQRNKAFDPPVLLIQTGTAVNFPNLDTVRHHGYSFSAVHPFELKLYAGVPAKPVLFDKPGVASLGCNIHDRMSAYIVVVSTPIFARTNEQGQASVEVPDGQHVLQTWHLSMGDAGAPIRQSIKVGTGVATRVTVTLPNGFGAHAL